MTESTTSPIVKGVAVVLAGVVIALSGKLPLEFARSRTKTNARYFFE